MANFRAGKKDKRGSSYDKRARKRWLLGQIEDRTLGWAPFGGDGTHVPCVHCHKPLTVETVESDRIVPGGSYARSNVQPSCGPCNKERGNNPNWIGPAHRQVGVV